MPTYHLGIDCGTQGLSVILTDGSVSNHPVVAVGESAYGILPSKSPEICEQRPDEDWIAGVSEAMADLKGKLDKKGNAGSGILNNIASIGISGQMHGEVLVDGNGNVLSPARLWCDGRNAAEGEELTALFSTKVAKRATVARFLWTIRNQPEKAAQVNRITTPAGYIAYHLTGEFNLGIGEASGMFPIDQNTLDYDESMLKQFDDLVKDTGIKPIRDLLPKVRLAGQDGGTVSEAGAANLGLPQLATTIVPVAPAEGDQVAALAGSLIATPGQVSCSFGTSVCANSVGDRTFVGVSPAVDHFCAADGRPINMVWLRNGTTFMNTVVQMFGTVLNSSGGEEEDGSSSGDNIMSAAFQAVMPRVLKAAPNCRGLLALPFMDDEPGLRVSRGGSAGLYGLDGTNADAGNAVKAALLSVMFNLKLGSEVLTEQGFPRTELILSGGLTKTPELGQILADVFDAKVTLFDSAAEGTAWGATLMAAYRHQVVNASKEKTWSDFLGGVDKGQANTQFLPDADRVAAYQECYGRYKKLVEAEAMIGNAVG